LTREGVCGCRGGHNAGRLPFLQLLGGVLDVSVGLRLWQSSSLEEVLSVEQQIAEAIAGHGDLLPVHAGQLESALEERVCTQSVDDFLCCIRVNKFIGTQLIQ